MITVSSNKHVSSIEFLLHLSIFLDDNPCIAYTLRMQVVLFCICCRIFVASK